MKITPQEACLALLESGGKGSGHFGHRGIPGHQGGSLPGDKMPTKKPFPPDYRRRPTEEEMARLRARMRGTEYETKKKKSGINKEKWKELEKKYALSVFVDDYEQERMEEAWNNIIGDRADEEDLLDAYLKPLLETSHRATYRKVNVVGGFRSLRISVMVRGENDILLGDLSRSLHFDPGTGEITVHHNGLEMDVALQGQPGTASLGKRLLGASYRLYKKLGVAEIHTNADIDVGSYAWAKYGFLPLNLYVWDQLRDRVLSRLNSMQEDYPPGLVSTDTVKLVRKLTRSKDTRALWAIADIRDPWTGDGEYSKSNTVGKRLLMGIGWNAVLDLRQRTERSKQQMKRFLSYINYRRG